jgi:hypothetical protein
MITVTEFEKAEWSRMAAAAYRAGRNDVGRRYSVAASIPRNRRLPCKQFDELQSGYREWLITGEFPRKPNSIDDGMGGTYRPGVILSL